MPVQTILLQDKQKKNYCVACQELDSDVDKDNPGKSLCRVRISVMTRRKSCLMTHPELNSTALFVAPYIVILEIVCADVKMRGVFLAQTIGFWVQSEQSMC